MKTLTIFFKRVLIKLFIEGIKKITVKMIAFAFIFNKISDIDIFCIYIQIRYYFFKQLRKFNGKFPCELFNILKEHTIRNVF